jgi:hypothetical protein
MSILTAFSMMDDKILSPVDSEKIPFLPDQAIVNASKSANLPEITPRSSDENDYTRFSTYSSIGSTSTAVETAEWPVRISTSSRKLSSGFPYHHALFDLHVSPRDWSNFSTALVEATKLTSTDRAAIAATVACIAITSHIGTSIYAGRKVYDSRQAKRVRNEWNYEAPLGQVLQSWNDNFFAKYGIEAQLEVGETTCQQERAKAGDEQAKKKKGMMDRCPLILMRKETRTKRAEEKKFVILLNPSGTSKCSQIAEMAADAPIIAELPAEVPKELAS